MIILVVAVVAIGAISIMALLYIEPKQAVSSVEIPTISVNYTNFADVLSESSLVGDLPKGATLLLRFYNLNSGEREWEKSYIMKKRIVVEGISEADITFVMHSKYLDTLTNKNFCEIIKTAKANGNLSVETKLSKMALLWKFKSMYKYRECLGF